MQTVIAEKPSVAKDIARVIGANNAGRDYYEGSGYYVTWCYGHLTELDIPEAGKAWDLKTLPVLPERFGLKAKKLATKPGQNDRLTIIKMLFNKSDSIIVATDAGREGELIFRNLYEYLGCRKPFRRLWISSMTDQAISEGFADLHPGSEFDNLAAAAKQREQADWLVGINATRALTMMASSGSVLSLGRVQTPTLCMICQRYVENKKFVPTPFWYIQGESTKDGLSFRWRSVDRYEKKEDAEAAYSSMRITGFLTVDEVVTERKSENPPLLHDIASVQKAANAKYSMPIDYTLELVQSLYEKKYVTYPRTGSRYIPKDVFATIPKILTQMQWHPLYGQYAKNLEGQKLNQRSVNDTKITDHHALLVTGIRPKDLSDDEQKVYDLIFSRVLEAFSPVCVADVTSIRFSSGTAVLEAKGRKDISLGWRAVCKGGNYEEVQLKDVDEVELDMKPLPEMTEGDIVEIGQADIIEDKTKPKPLLTGSTLLTAMENAGQKIDEKEVADALKDIGIGTPATRSEILKTLITRSYVKYEGKKLVPTRLGLLVYVTVKDRSIANVELTARWEIALGDIAEGRADAEAFGRNIREYTKKVVDNLLRIENLDKLKAEVQTETLACPKCGKEIKVYDKSAWCKECGFTIWRDIAGKHLSVEAMRKLITEGTTGLLSGFKGKNDKEFSAFVKRDDDGRLSFEFDKGSVVKCPKCGKDITLSGRGAFCDCGLTVWRTVAGKKLSDDQLSTLLKNKSIKTVKGFVSKSGKSFDAGLRLDGDWKVAFVFEEKH